MGVLHNRKAQKTRRQALRNEPTPAERALWQKLKGSRLHGRKFRRQHGVGPYFVDFFCPTERLIVELDGASHDDPARAEYDTHRQRDLEALGIRALRFENREVFATPDLVLAATAFCFRDASDKTSGDVCNAQPESPPPQARRGPGGG